MSLMHLARAELLSMQPYSSARLEASAAAIMLNANEAPRCLLADDTLELNRYPEPQPKALLEKLAQRYGVSPGQIFVGRGSDEAIDLLTRAFCRAGTDQVLIQPPTFGMYKVAAQVQGAGVLEIPLRAEADFAPDFAQIAAALTPQTKIVYVCTPNNPTGGEVDPLALENFLELTRGRCLVVVDEAYGEFSARASWCSQLARFPQKFPHLAVLRTLSKAFGLAGARIGVLVAQPEIIALLRRIMAPYPLPRASVAAAMAVLDLASQVDAATRAVIAERERMRAALLATGCVLRVWPSSANFLSFRVRDAQAVYQALIGQGIVIRSVSHYLGLANCLRVSVGLETENNAFLQALSGLSA